MNMSEPADSFARRGGGWVVAQSILMLAVIALGWAFREHPRLTWVSIVGAGLVATGGYFGIAGVRTLGRNRTPYPRPRSGSTLVQHGIYARVRHPLYTSVILVSLGWTAIWQSGPALLATLATAVFFHAKARREELWLTERFPDYPIYARRVPRFVPSFVTHLKLWL